MLCHGTASTRITGFSSVTNISAARGEAALTTHAPQQRSGGNERHEPVERIQDNRRPTHVSRPKVQPPPPQHQGRRCVTNTRPTTADGHRYIINKSVHRLQAITYNNYDNTKAIHRRHTPSPSSLKLRNSEPHSYDHKAYPQVSFPTR